MPKVKTNTEPPLLIKNIRKVMQELCGKATKDSTKTVKKPKKGK